MLHCAHSVGRDLQEQLDRQNYITNRYKSQKKDTNKKFFDKRDARAGVRIKGEVKRGGTEKMKRDRKRERDCSFNAFPVDVYSGTNPRASRKGQ